MHYILAVYFLHNLLIHLISVGVSSLVVISQGMSDFKKK